MVVADLCTGALSCWKVYSPVGKEVLTNGSRLVFINSMYLAESILPLTHAKVRWPSYVIAPQTMTDTRRCVGGQTMCGEFFSSSLLQQYILESLPRTTEHLSENIYCFQESCAQFLLALHHLTRFICGCSV